MAQVHLDFESQYCRFNQDVYIILPDRRRRVDAKDFYQRDRRYRVLLLQEHARRDRPQMLFPHKSGADGA